MSKISVCIPVYNGERFLRQAIDSVLSQDYPDFELIVVDDASTDHSVDIIHSFKDSRLHFHQNPVSLGIPGNWNIAMSKASGRYIKFVFQDDIIYQDCLSSMLAPMRGHENIGMVFSKRNVEAEDGIRTDQFYLHIKDLQAPLKKGVPSGVVLKGLQLLEIIIRSAGTSINPIAEPSFVMFDARLIPRVGYFDSRLRQNVDYDYWLRFLMLSDTVFIDRPLGCFRLHNRSESSSGTTVLTKLRYIWEEQIILENLKKLAMKENAEAILPLLDMHQKWFYFFRLGLLFNQRLGRMRRKQIFLA